MPIAHVRADGARQLQTVQLGEAFEQADDVTGIEGIAAARAVDEVDRIVPSLTRRSSEADCTPCSPRVITTRFAPMSRKIWGLADRVVLAQDEGGFVGVGDEDIGVRQNGAERLDVMALAWAWRRPEG